MENNLLIIGKNIFNIYSNILNISIYNNALYLILNSVITSLLGFVFWNILARFFPPDQIGIGSALVAASGLVANLGNLGLGIALVRFIPEDGGNAVRLINSSFTLNMIAVTTGSLIYIIGLKHWSPSLVFIGKYTGSIVIFVILTVAIGLSVLVDQPLIAGHASRLMFFKNVLVSVLKLPLPILVFSHLGGFGIFVATGLASIVGILLAMYLFIPSLYNGYKPVPNIEFKILIPILTYAIYSYFASLFNSSIGLLLPLIVLNRLGPEQSAYFYIAWMINSVVGVIAFGMSTSLLAEGAKDCRAISWHFRRLLYITMLLLLPAVIGIIILAPWFLHFFGYGYASHGTPLIRWLALSNFPVAIGLFYMTVNQIKKNLKLIVIQTFSTSFLTLGLGYWLLGIFGLTGIGIAYGMAQLIVALVVAIPLWRTMKEGAYAGGDL